MTYRSEKWSGRLDSNQRPPAPKAGALPGCATPRHHQRQGHLLSHAPGATPAAPGCLPPAAGVECAREVNHGSSGEMCEPGVFLSDHPRRRFREILLRTLQAERREDRAPLRLSPPGLPMRPGSQRTRPAVSPRSAGSDPVAPATSATPARGVRKDPVCIRRPPAYQPLQSNLNPHRRHLMHPLTFARSCDSPHRGHTVSPVSDPSGPSGRGAVGSFPITTSGA